MKKPDGLKKYTIEVVVAARSLSDAEAVTETAVELIAQQVPGVLRVRTKATGERLTAENIAFLGYDEEE